MKIGIALSGGGSRGIAHLGALKALEELGIKPDAVTGTSAGSIIGAMVAEGYSPDEIFEIVKSAGISNHLSFAFNRFGLYRMNKLENLLQKYIPHNSFEKLKLPLTVCTTDIEAGEPEYFSEGELCKPIMASCSIPGIFEPIKFNGKTYIDGGIMNNLPIEPLEGSCDFIIGINVMTMQRDMPIKSAKDVLMKSLLLRIRQQAKENLRRCDIAIEPDEIARFSPLSLKKADEMYRIGYEKTLRESEGKLSQIF